MSILAFSLKWFFLIIIIIKKQQLLVKGAGLIALETGSPLSIHRADTAARQRCSASRPHCPPPAGGQPDSRSHL